MGLELGKLWLSVRADSSKLRADFGLVKKQSQDLVRTVNKTLAGIGIGTLAVQALKLSASFQKTRISFQAMLGSAEKANNMMKQLRSLTRETPFGFEELKDNTKFLLAVGIAEKDLIDNMRTLSSVAAGTGADFHRLAKAYADVSARGALYGQEIRQFAEAGIPLINLLAVYLGKTRTETLKLSEDGKLAFSEVEKVLKALTSGSGKFATILGDQVNTVEGQFRQFKNELDFVLTDVGVVFENLNTEILRTAKYLVLGMGDGLDQVKNDWKRWADEIADGLKTMRENWDLTWEIMMTQMGIQLARGENRIRAFFDILPPLVDAAKGTMGAYWDLFKGTAQNTFEWLKTTGKDLLFGAATATGKSYVAVLKKYGNMIERTFIGGSGIKMYPDFLTRSNKRGKNNGVFGDFIEGIRHLLPQQKMALEPTPKMDLWKEIKNIWSTSFAPATSNLDAATSKQADLITKAQDTIKSVWDKATSKINVQDLLDAMYPTDTPAIKAAQNELDRLTEAFGKAWAFFTKERTDAERANAIRNIEDKRPLAGTLDRGKSKKIDRMSGISELGKKIQQEILDKDAERQEKMLRLQEENNDQNKEVVSLLRQSNNKWDLLSNLGGLV